MGQDDAYGEPQGIWNTNNMFLNKIAKTLIITTVSIILGTPLLQAKNNEVKDFDWSPLMDAITQVESEGNENAVNGPSCGPMQITPILVQDCNDILKSRGDDKRFTQKDRFSTRKSREMFRLIQSRYNPTNNIERAIRLWNGGVHYTRKSTQKYYQKVMKEYRKMAQNK